MFFKRSKVCAIFLFGIGITGVQGQSENKTGDYLDKNLRVQFLKNLHPE